MGLEERRALLSAIEDQRGTRAVAYVTSDRPNLSAIIAGDAVPIIADHLRPIADDGKDLDLVLYSRGGQSSVPWNLVSTIREFCGERKFNVLIPFRAHSAATMIAIGADEIVMTRKAELGPIDTTLQGPYSPRDQHGNPLPVSAEDMMGYFSLLERVADARPDEQAAAFHKLAEHVHPIGIGNVHRMLRQTELVAMRLLGTRLRPPDESAARNVAQLLASEIYDHNHAISRTEARRNIGLTTVVNAEEVGVDASLWTLYEDYKDMFEFNVPFDPNSHMIENELELHEWPGMPLACVESTGRSDVFRQDMRVRRIRQVPPKVDLNFSNLGMPPINIPELPEGLDAQGLANIVQQAVAVAAQQAINAAADRASQDFLRSLPTQGFEMTPLNARWRTEYPDGL